MIFVGCMILAVWLFAVPFFVGGIFTDVDKYGKNILFRWISGQLLLWAGFQLLCVPLVLLEKDYTWVVLLFGIYTVCLVGFSLLLYMKNRPKTRLRLVKEKAEKSRWEKIAWGIFALLLLFQMIQAVRMTYADGDDAYYVAVSTITENAKTMYQKLPYTGGIGGTELDARHGLAPFPIWIAFLASISGIPSVSVAHVALPMALLAMTYGIFALLGGRLLERKKEFLPVFLIFTQLLVLFGDYSFYTAENFMIARSRQGKAAIGSIVIPVLILLLLILLEKVQENGKISVKYWILLTAAMTAGCLCTTLGTLLTCMLVGAAGVCGAVCYRRFRMLLPMAACCTPCGIYALLYLIL